MTCIAWRNNIMACDSCWTYGDTRVASQIKIKRLKSGALLGQAGDNDARAIEALLDNVKDPKQLPTKDQLAATHDSFMGLLALPKGGVWVVSSGPVNEAGWPEEASEDYGVWLATSMGGYCAVGSGGDHALSAMDVGPQVSAARGCEIACRRNTNCHPPIHQIRLFDTNHPDPKKAVVRGKASHKK